MSMVVSKRKTTSTGSPPGVISVKVQRSVALPSSEYRSEIVPVRPSLVHGSPANESNDASAPAGPCARWLRYHPSDPEALPDQLVLAVRRGPGDLEVLLALVGRPDQRDRWTSRRRRSRGCRDARRLSRTAEASPGPTFGLRRSERPWVRRRE
jgi:hypothetical protein